MPSEKEIRTHALIGPGLWCVIGYRESAENSIFSTSHLLWP
jgi:hypothetical protein